MLLVDNGGNVNLERASRNLEGVTLVPAMGLETYDLMRHERLILSRECAEKLSRALSAGNGEPAGKPLEAARATEAPETKPKREAKAKTKSPTKAAAPKKAAKPKSAAKPKAKKG